MGPATAELRVTRLDVAREFLRRVRLVPHLLRGHVIEMRITDRTDHGNGMTSYTLTLACARCEPIDWTEYS
jgi:hypothetical protein